MSTENAAGKLRMPRSTWFIVTTEACERFSFYGMTSILTLYLQYQLAMGKGRRERTRPPIQCRSLLLAAIGRLFGR